MAGAFRGPAPGERNPGHRTKEGEGGLRARGEPLQHLLRGGHDDPGIRGRPRNQSRDALRIHSQLDEGFLRRERLVPRMDEMVPDVDDEIDPAVPLLAQEHGDAERGRRRIFSDDDATTPALSRIDEEPLPFQLTQGRLDRFGVDPQFPGES